jgi:hypothetical protein
MFVTPKAGTHICLLSHTLSPQSTRTLQCFRLAHLAQDWEQVQTTWGIAFVVWVIVGIHRVLGNMFVVDRD